MSWIKMLACFYFFQNTIENLPPVLDTPSCDVQVGGRMTRHTSAALQDLRGSLVGGSRQKVHQAAEAVRPAVKHKPQAAQRQNKKTKKDCIQVRLPTQLLIIYSHHILLISYYNKTSHLHPTLKATRRQDSSFVFRLTHKTYSTLGKKWRLK